MADDSSSATPGDADTRPWWQRWWVVLLVFPAAVLAIVGALVFFLVFSAVPLPDEIGLGSSVVLDRDGGEVGTLAAEAARRDVTVDELPEHVSQAVMAAEDRSFYDHGGISATGVVRALFENARAGEVSQGGSTVTQQYIKNAALTSERTITRKLKEAALAIKLERRFTKDEILGLYLSTIYLGRGAYGIDAAARTYFDVPAAELNVNQAAMLAGMIASPENLDPLDAPEAADRRRIYALDGMLEQGWLDEQQHQELVVAGLPEVSTRQSVARGPNAYYLDAVRRELTDRFGSEAAVFTGLRVHTELDQRMQSAAQQEVARAVSEGDFDSAALVTVDPASGGVRALVGGPDFSSQQLNLAVRDPRQVGSAFKPVTLAAFVAEGYSPESRFDAPASIRITDDYEPRNYGGQDFGEQTVWQATTTSTNTVYVQMQQLIGRDAVADAAGDLGLPTDGQDFVAAGAALTLGPADFTPLQMAGAYSTLANRGMRVTPHAVTLVEETDGTVVYRADVRTGEAIDGNTAAIVTEALRRNVVGGTGTAAALEGRPTAGKTGTTNDNRAAWFAGYVPQLATAVWVGNVDRSSVEGMTGGSSAAPLWGAYMARAVEGMEVIDFPSYSLDGLEAQNAEPEECPEGYARGPAPTETGTEGTAPDVIDDGEEQPCVEIAPSPSPLPSPSPSPSPSPLPTPSVTAPLPTESPSPSASPSPSPSASPTSDPSPTEASTGDSTSDDGGTTTQGGESPTPSPSA